MTIEIAAMQHDDARKVAQLHIENIQAGFLNRLGVRFLTSLYRGIQSDPDSSIWTARKEGALLGFCSYTRNVSGLYKRVLARNTLGLAFSAMPRGLNPWLIKEAWDTLRYPKKQRARNLPEAEVLSVAVDSKGRGKGIGRRLLETAVEQAKADRQPQLKLVAGAGLDEANSFYSRFGFEKRDVIVQHGHQLYVYVLDLGTDRES